MRVLLVVILVGVGLLVGTVSTSTMFKREAGATPAKLRRGRNNDDEPAAPNREDPPLQRDTADATAMLGGELRALNEALTTLRTTTAAATAASAPQSKPKDLDTDDSLSRNESSAPASKPATPRDINELLVPSGRASSPRSESLDRLRQIAERADTNVAQLQHRVDALVATLEKQRTSDLADVRHLEDKLDVARKVDANDAWSLLDQFARKIVPRISSMESRMHDLVPGGSELGASSTIAADLTKLLDETRRRHDTDVKDLRSLIPNTADLVNRTILELAKQRSEAEAAAELKLAEDPTAEPPLTLERLHRWHKHDTERIEMLLRQMPTTKDVERKIQNSNDTLRTDLTSKHERLETRMDKLRNELETQTERQAELDRRVKSVESSRDEIGALELRLDTLRDELRTLDHNRVAILERKHAPTVLDIDATQRSSDDSAEHQRLSAKVSRLGDDLDEFRASSKLVLDTHASTLEEHTVDNRAAKTALKAHTSSLQSLESKLKSLANATALDLCTTKIKDLESTLAEHTETMRDLATKTALDEYKTKTQDLESTLDEHAETMRDLATKTALDEHAALLQDLKSDFEAKRLGDLGSMINEHASTLKSHETDIESHKTTLKDLTATVAAHKTTLKTLEPDVEDHEAAIKSLRSDADEHKSGLEDLQTRVDAHKTKLKTLDTLETRLDDRIRAIDKKCSDLGSDLKDQIHDCSKFRTGVMTKTKLKEAIREVRDSKVNKTLLDETRNDLHTEILKVRDDAAAHRKTLEATDSELQTSLDKALKRLEADAMEREIRRYVTDELKGAQPSKSATKDLLSDAEAACHRIVDKAVDSVERTLGHRVDELEASLKSVDKTLDTVQHKSETRYSDLSEANELTIRGWITDGTKHVLKPLDLRVDELQTGLDRLRTSSLQQSAAQTSAAISTANQFASSSLASSAAETKLAPLAHELLLNDATKAANLEFDLQLRKHKDAADKVHDALGDRIHALEASAARSNGGSLTAKDKLYDALNPSVPSIDAKLDSAMAKLATSAKDSIETLENTLQSKIDTKTALIESLIGSQLEAKLGALDLNRGQSSADSRSDLGPRLSALETDVVALRSSTESRLSALERIKSLMVRNDELTQKLDELRASIASKYDDTVHNLSTQFDDLAVKFKLQQQTLVKVSSQDPAPVKSSAPVQSTAGTWAKPPRYEPPAAPVPSPAPAPPAPPKSVEPRAPPPKDSTSDRLAKLRSLYRRRFTRSTVPWPELDDGRVRIRNMEEFKSRLAVDLGIRTTADWQDRLHEHVFDANLTKRFVVVLERAMLDELTDFTEFVTELCREYVDDAMYHHAHDLAPDFVALYLLMPEVKYRRSAGQALAGRVLSSLDDRTPRTINIEILDDATIALLSLYAESSALGYGRRSAYSDNKWLNSCVNLRFRRTHGLMHDASYIETDGLLDVVAYDRMARHEFHEMARLVYEWLGLQMERRVDPYVEYQRLQIIIRHPLRPLHNGIPLQFAPAGVSMAAPPNSASKYGGCVMPVYGLIRYYGFDDSYIVRVSQSLWPQFTVSRGQSVGQLQEMVQGRTPIKSLDSGHRRTKAAAESPRKYHTFGMVISPAQHASVFSGDDSIVPKSAESFVMRYRDSVIAYQRYEYTEFGDYRVTELVTFDALADRREFLAVVENLGSATLTYIGNGGIELSVLGNSTNAFRTVLRNDTMDAKTELMQTSLGFPLSVPNTRLRVLQTSSSDEGGAWLLVDVRAQDPQHPLVCVPRNSKRMLDQRIRVTHDGKEWVFDFNSETNQWDKAMVIPSQRLRPEFTMLPTDRPQPPIETTRYDPMSNAVRRLHGTPHRLPPTRRS